MSKVVSTPKPLKRDRIISFRQIGWKIVIDGWLIEKILMWRLK